MANVEKLKWVQGNKLLLAIPMQIVAMTSEGKTISDYIPDEKTEISVFLSSYTKKFTYTPRVIQGNVLFVEDDATLAVGVYDVTINVVEPNGTKRRSHWNKQIEICYDNSEVLEMYDDFPDYAEGQIIDASVFFFAGEGGVVDYNDIINKPDLSVYAKESWVNQQGFLKEHQDISGKASIDDLSQVAFSGNYDDLEGRPTSLSSFTNDVGYITQHQDISGKENKVIIDVVSDSSLQANVGKYYRFDNVVNSLSITLPSVSDVSHLSSVIFSFTTGEEPQITISSSGGTPIRYFDGFAIEANTSYELNAMFNGVKWIIAYGIIE